MSNIKNSTASSEAANNDVSNLETFNPPLPPKPAVTQDPIKLIALTPEGGTENINTIRIAKEDAHDTSPLSEEEKASLDRYEEIIRQHLGGYNAVGEALHHIQTRRLYRGEHPTFEAYVTAVWKFKRAHAYRLINAFRVQESIQDEEGYRLSESQARALGPLTSEQRQQALHRAKELAGEKKRTAAHFKQAANEILGTPPKAPRSVKKTPKSDDNHSNEGGTPPTPATPPALVPGSGASAPIENVFSGPIPFGAKSMEEIIDNLRTRREEILPTRDFDAAIRLLDRLEADLQAHIAKNRDSARALEQISIDSDLKLQAV